MTDPTGADGAQEIQLHSRTSALPEHADMVAALLDWFDKNMRPLPWRKSYDPYEVLVSEIMLQQTQMDRVGPYFERWMRRFPDIAAVAAASPEALLKCWEGLGYYSRVRNLQKTAQIILEKHDGKVPSDKADLLALPGIGEYTAGAVLSIAFNQTVAAVDANVERVFARLFDIDAPVKSTIASDFIRYMADALIPEGRAREFNQALMDLGSLVCSRKPDCGNCPLAGYCQAKRLGIVAERPVPGKKVSYSALEIVSGVLVHNGRIFLQKRLDTGVWAGFWEFPGGRLEAGEEPSHGIVREYREETNFRVAVSAALGTVRHAYTRYRIRMHCFLLSLEERRDAPHDKEGFPIPALNAATQYRWLPPDELLSEAYTLPAGHRKLLDAWFPQLRKAARYGNE